MKKKQRFRSLLIVITLLLILTSLITTPVSADETVNIIKSRSDYQYFLDYNKRWTTLGIDGASYRTKTRFNSFYNVPELSNMFRQAADIQTADMLNLPTPKLKTGQVQTILIKPSEIQKNIIKKIGQEAGTSSTNMLELTTRGRKTAIDQRLVNPLLPDDPNSKINTVMENVYKIWEETSEGRKTQMVFLDMSTPKKNGSFSLYDDLKQKWIDKGIPENEIAFAQNYNDVEKTDLYNKVNKGEIRILVGSTQSLGAGTNAQERLYALHHVDCPWKPSDLEQREGRILRQGNTNEEVEIFRYITENTFDLHIHTRCYDKYLCSFGFIAIFFLFCIFDISDWFFHIIHIKY